MTESGHPQDQPNLKAGQPEQTGSKVNQSAKEEVSTRSTDEQRYRVYSLYQGQQRLLSRSIFSATVAVGVYAD